MKNEMLIIASVCLLATLAGRPAFAQRGGVRAQIPFNFALSGKSFSAGQYTMIAAPHAVSIEDANGTIVAVALANEISGDSKIANGRIVFRCYGYRCFLSELWSPVEENGRQLPTPRIEMELRKEQKGAYFAVLGEKPRE
jgi:hypothetical protein